MSITDMLGNFMQYNKSIPKDAETIMQHFVKMGYTPNQVAGAIGNAVKKGAIVVTGKQYCSSRNKMVNLFI